MRKRYFFRKVMVLLLVCAVLSGSIGQQITVHAAGTADASKKIISVVYDDSGSMFDDNNSWAKANYAIQAFAALMNEQDEMYITYMSHLENGAVKVNLKEPEKAVKKIRSEISKGGTPMESVEIAMDKLEKIQESDLNTQFWLVILTDGEMQASASNNDLQRLLDNCAGTTMSNGSALYVDYMGIGSGAVDINDHNEYLDAENRVTDIVPSLSQIANKISGRMVFDPSDVTVIDGKTVKVHADIPLYSISIFSQESDAVVVSADLEGNLTVDRNIALFSPEYKGLKDETLFGNAAMITNGDHVIPAGDCTITFSKDVDIKKTVIMYQPAIKLKAFIKRKGIEITDFSALARDDVVDVELLPVNPENDDVIEDSKLPEGITWEISYQVNGQELEHASGRKLTDITVQTGDNAIVGTMLVPEYVPQSQTISFEIRDVPPVIYGIKTNPSDDADFPRKSMGEKGCTGQPTTFQITGDEIPLTKDQLNGEKLIITATEIDQSGLQKTGLDGFIEKFGFMDATPGLKVKDDGTIVLHPKNRGILPAIFFKSGTYTVNVALESDPSIQAEGSFTLSGDAGDLWSILPFIVFVLLVLYCCYIFFVKYKFNPQTITVSVYQAKGFKMGASVPALEDQITLNRYSGGLFWPTRRCSCTVGGFKLYANLNGQAYLKKSTIADGERYGVSASNPINDFAGVLANLNVTTAKAPKDHSVTPAPYYIYMGGMLYCFKKTN